MEQSPRALCDGCGCALAESRPVIYDCFHALHAACANGSDACPCCGTPEPEVEDGGGGAPSSPPDSSVAGDVMRGNSGGDDEYDPSEYWTLCVVCGGQFRTLETFYCPHCTRTPPSSSPWSSFGSPSPSPSHVDQFGQPPPAMAAPSGTGRSEQPPQAPPANPVKPPAQLGPPPSCHYCYMGFVGQPPPAAPHTFASPAPPPQPYQTGQFGYPAPSQHPSQFPHPPPQQQPLFDSPYYYKFPPVGPAPPPSYYPFQTSTFQYQQQQPAPAPVPAMFANAPPPSCAFCGGAVVPGQTAVTSQCGHTFHFRCFSSFTHSVFTCPACGEQWQDMSQPYGF